MDNKKFEVILNSLLNRTKRDELSWKTTANSYKYLLVLKDSSIVINKDNVYMGDFIEFEFKNERGETVEKAMVNSINVKEYEKASELYDLARRRALKSNETVKSDETIDKIIKQLSPESLAA